MGQEIDPKAAEQANSGGIDVRLGGLESLGLQDGTFDAITLSHVIEHLHREPAADPATLTPRSLASQLKKI